MCFLKLSTEPFGLWYSLASFAVASLCFRLVISLELHFAVRRDLAARGPHPRLARFTAKWQLEKSHDTSRLFVLDEGEHRLPNARSAWHRLSRCYCDSRQPSCLSYSRNSKPQLDVVAWELSAVNGADEQVIVLTICSSHASARSSCGRSLGCLDLRQRLNASYL
jgi:hypothetical protein